MGALFSLLALILVWIAPENYSEAFVLGNVLLLGIVLAIHLYFSIHVAGNNPLIGLDVWYLTGLVAVSFSIPFLLLFSGLSYSGIGSLAGAKYFSQAVAISLLAVCAFSTGFLWSWSRKQRSTKVAVRALNGALLRPLAIAFAVPGVVLLLYFLVSSGAYYLSGSYNEVSTIAERYEVPFSISQILLTLSICCIVLRTRRLRQVFRMSNLFFLAAYFVMILVLLIHGDRGGIIMLSSPILFTIFRGTTQRLQVPILLGVLLFALVAITVMRTSRNLSERTFGGILDVAGEVDVARDVKTAALNLGGSGLLLPVAMAHVDDDGIAFGRYFMVTSLGILPYSRRILIYAGVLPRWDHYESASLLTEIVNGKNAKSGVGTTVTVEFYLDFGVVGVVLGQFFIGWMAALLQYSVRKSQPDLRVVIIYVFSLGIFAVTARYSAGAFLVKLLGQAAIAVRIGSYMFGSSGSPSRALSDPQDEASELAEREKSTDQGN